MHSSSHKVYQDMEHQPYDVTMYVPCRTSWRSVELFFIYLTSSAPDFDFSQVEFVAPFLQRYGGKVFLYKWHTIKSKMAHYYADKAQYPNVEIDDFSLGNIVRHVLSEQKKVVFLLTASTAYPFGQYQRALLQKIKDRLPDRIASINTIGHCMYGCASCKGADHKLPVYFTRYFNERCALLGCRSCVLLTLTFSLAFRIPPPTFASVISPRPASRPAARLRFRCWWRPRPAALPSSCSSPSWTSSTACSRAAASGIHSPSGLPLALFRSADTGFHSSLSSFVWKMHPSVYAATYDDSYQSDELEWRNVKFVRKNFETTDETQPCLLPFF